MRRWARVQFAARCGLCGMQLPDGAYHQLVQLPFMKRELVRCPSCADGLPPPTLPDTHARERAIYKPMQQIAATKPEWLPYREAE